MRAITNPAQPGRVGRCFRGLREPRCCRTLVTAFASFKTREHFINTLRHVALINGGYQMPSGLAPNIGFHRRFSQSDTAFESVTIILAHMLGLLKSL